MQIPFWIRIAINNINMQGVVVVLGYKQEHKIIFCYGFLLIYFKRKSNVLPTYYTIEFIQTEQQLKTEKVAE